jgi:CubicO group peptidase (beta-lactamase class C family)
VTDNDLKAVIAGVSVAGQPVLTKAWGESMTGVPATYDMHFLNGSVAIAYLGVVTLQLQEKGVLSLDDKLAKWFPDYPKASALSRAGPSDEISALRPEVDQLDIGGFDRPPEEDRADSRKALRRVGGEEAH